MRPYLGQTPQYERMRAYLTKLQRVVSRLATVDQTEVCPLSRGVMSQPLSRPLQPTFAFSVLPYLHNQQRPLRFACQPKDSWQPYRLTTFPACHTTDVGSAYPPVA